MSARRQCFVEFLSPGTFGSETTSRPIEQWDIKTAVRLAKEIVERHGAKPYGFVFKTLIVAEPVDDGEGGKLEVAPRAVETSGTHYLDGELIRFEAVPESILRSNMRCNRWPVVCETRNSWRHVGIFEEKDKNIESATGRILHDGGEERLKAYRAERIAEWDAKTGTP